MHVIPSIRTSLTTFGLSVELLLFAIVTGGTVHSPTKCPPFNSFRACPPTTRITRLYGNHWTVFHSGHYHFACLPVAELQTSPVAKVYFIPFKMIPRLVDGKTTSWFHLAFPKWVSELSILCAHWLFVNLFCKNVQVFCPVLIRLFTFCWYIWDLYIF